jgi:hypothetical protein
MTNILTMHPNDAPVERTPEQAHCFALLDRFTEALEAFEAPELSRRERLIAKNKVALCFYELLTTEVHALYPRLGYFCEVAIEAHGISCTPPLSAREKKAAMAKYETEYVRETELNLLAAQAGLQAPNLSKESRDALEDNVTFFGAELVWQEKTFKSASLRRACTKLIDAHIIDREEPLRYHEA